MGRLLGSFADEDELDRPDLNKCPDCECFFDGDECPICGKVCPEEYRAGNRKAVKKKRNKGGTQYRVTFIPWYHSWWFILLMMFFSPFSIAGIVLLLTSPHKKGMKILFVTLMLIYASHPRHYGAQKFLFGACRQIALAGRIHQCVCGNRFGGIFPKSDGK